MENKRKITKLLGAASILGALLFSFNAFSLEQEHEAANCSFSGNGSDYCNASSGSQNVKVLECRPGTTDCNYDLDEPSDTAD